jgi:hypothetical protein
VLRRKVTNPFLAAGHREQFAVGGDRPLPVQARLRKSAVEGQAVTVALGIGQRPVHVENHRLQD